MSGKAPEWIKDRNPIFLDRTSIRSDSPLWAWSRSPSLSTGIASAGTSKGADDQTASRLSWDLVTFPMAFRGRESRNEKARGRLKEARNSSQ